MNVANERVAASAACRSSSTRTIGRSAATRPSQRSRDSRARGWRRSGSARSLARGPGTRSARSAMPGRPSRIGRASRASSASTSSPGRSASSGPQRIEHGRPGRVDGSVGLPAEDERRLGAGDDPVERLVEEAGHAHPGAARDDDRRRRARRGARDGVDDPRELRLPADEPATDHATRHGRHCRGAATASPERVPPRRDGVPPRRAAPDRVRCPVTERRAPHPANDLNELPGEEWLYFTKSVWTTAYPSELGHARRRAHGANKPPRLMARLIEFFTPHRRARPRPVRGRRRHAARAPRSRAARGGRIGIELDPRWAAVFAETVAALQRRARRRGPAARGPRRRNDPGGAARLRPVGHRAAPGRRAGGPPDPRGRVRRLRRHRPAVQRPAADDDGRRQARRDPREPAHRLRDVIRPPRGPRQPPRLPGLPRRDERGSCARSTGCCGPAATPC